MNTNRKVTFARYTAIVAAALLASVTVANAGGQRHVMPADYGKTHPTYEFKIVSMPSASTPFTVQLLNAATGQPVANAHVSMQHLVWMGNKAVPQVQRVQVGLEPDGRGDYTCTHGPLQANEALTLRAHVPGESPGTWLTVALNV